MLCDKLYSEQLRQKRLREVRRQETELARGASKSFSNSLKFSEAERQREAMEKLYNDKVGQLKELERQREETLSQLGSAHRAADEKEREDDERAKERLEWARQAADRAVERGRAALSQTYEWARQKEVEENYLVRRREEVLKNEAEKAKRLATAWQERQKIEAERKEAEDAANFIPPGGLVVKGQFDFSKTHFHNPVIVKHQLSQKTAAESALEAAAEAEIRSEELKITKDAQRRSALERGQEALTKEQLKQEHARLVTELQKIRKADGDLKIAKGASDQVAASRNALTLAKIEEQKKQRAERQFQEVFLSAGPSSILEVPKAPVKNVWEQRRLSEKPRVVVPETAEEPGKLKKIVINEGPNTDPFESLISSYKTQSTPDSLPLKTIEKRLEEHKTSESDIESYKEEERENSGEEDSGEKGDEDEYEYSDISSESNHEEEKLDAKYRRQPWRPSESVKIVDEDEILQDLTSKDEEIKKIWGEIKDPVPAVKSRSEVLELDSSGYKSSPASSFAKPPVPRLDKAPMKSEQYYIDILTTPAFNKNQPTFRPSEDEDLPRDLGMYSAAKANMKESLLSESLSSLLNSKSSLQKTHDFDRYLRSDQSDTFKLSQTDDLRYSKTDSKIGGEAVSQNRVDVEKLLGSEGKSTAWEIKVEPRKATVKPEAKPVKAWEVDSTFKSSNRGRSQERQAEAWNLEVESESQQGSLADAFRAKRRDLANKLENRPIKSKEPHKEKSKEELQAIRKNMLKGSNRSHSIEVEIRKTQPKNSQLMDRLASGERTKVTKNEMKQLTAKNYDNLPEVKAKREKEAKKAEIKQRLVNAKEFEKKRKESRLKRIASPAKFS